MKVFHQIRGWTLKEKAFGALFLAFLIGVALFFLCYQPKRPASQEQAVVNVPETSQPVPSLPLDTQTAGQIPRIEPVPIQEAGGQKPESLPRSGVLPMRVCEYPYLGFSLRVPEGWRLDIERGRILVCREDLSSACVLICPTLLQRGADLTDFLKNEFQTQLETLKGLGAKLTLQEPEAGEIVQARIGGSIHGIKVQGRARAFQKDALGLWEAIWAPEEEWTDLMQTLSVVEDSFSRFQPKSMELFEGQIFGVAYPKDWRVTEGPYRLAVSPEDQSGGFFVNFSIYLPGNPTPAEYVKLFDKGNSRVTDLEVLWEREYPAFIDPLGQRWKVLEREILFDHRATGRKRGLMRAAVVSQGNNFSAIMTLRYAPVTEWGEQKATLAQIESSFRIARPERLGGGKDAVQFPKNLDLPGFESLPKPGGQEEWW